jgi:hypothetical protein
VLEHVFNVQEVWVHPQHSQKKILQYMLTIKMRIKDTEKQIKKETYLQSNHCNISNGSFCFQCICSLQNGVVVFPSQLSTGYSHMDGFSLPEWTSIMCGHHNLLKQCPLLDIIFFTDSCYCQQSCIAFKNHG